VTNEITLKLGSVVTLTYISLTLHCILSLNIEFIYTISGPVLVYFLPLLHGEKIDSFMNASVISGNGGSLVNG